MVTFADPAHFMSKSAVPPLEWSAPTGNSTGGWPVCAHPPPPTSPAGSTAVLLHPLLATLTQPSAQKPIVPCYRNYAAIVLHGETWSSYDTKVARQQPTVTFTLPEAWLHRQSQVSFSLWLNLCSSQPTPNILSTRNVYCHDVWSFLFPSMALLWHLQLPFDLHPSLPNAWLPSSCCEA